MKTKKFLMTSLLVMGMIIAKAANGYPPELVLVSQPVLTYNANSVTVYYDVQNIGDYTYRGNLYIYLDPDNGYCYGSEYMKVRPGCIRRVAVTIPAYRPNPSWVYTVMPYYELYDELFSFTMFEYFEPVRFCWYGHHTEPWVVIHIPPRPRHYHRPGDYRYYYDGYRPPMPPPGGPHHHMPPMDPHHHTYAYHHSNGGYPANFTPAHETPGYNKPSEATVIRPNGGNTSGSMSSRASTTTNNSGNSGATTRPSTNTSGNNGATTRPSTSGNSGSTSGSSSTVRPSSNSSSSSSSSGRTGTTTNNGSNVSRPSGSSSSSSSNSGTVSRPSSGSSSNRSGSSSSSSNRSSSSTSSSRSSSSDRSGTSSSSSSSRSSSSSSSSRSGSSSGRR